MLQFLDFPVPRHCPEPLHTGFHQRHSRIEAPGNGVTNDRLPLLFQQGDQPRIPVDQRIYPTRFPVEELGDGPLFGRRR